MAAVWLVGARPGVKEKAAQLWPDELIWLLAWAGMGRFRVKRPIGAVK